MSAPTGRPCVGLVVPSLTGGGGVQAVARFLSRVAVESDRFDLRVVSLPESAWDPQSVRLGAPGSWLRGPGAVSGQWQGLPFAHVGAIASELEFQRYQPRRILTRLLASCDVIQVVCGFPAWANAVLDAGVPVAVHVATLAREERRQRDADPRGVLGRWRKLMTAITDRLDDRALRRVAAIQVMNPWMLDYATVLNTGRPVDVRFLPPGLDTHTFRPRDAGTPAGEPYILCVGRLGDPRKRVDLLLEAFAALPEPWRGQAKLVLAGPQPPPETLWPRAEALGVRDRVRYIERPSDEVLVRLYQDARVFASSSDEEGFGMVLLEAMACGVPVVSTRSGGPDGILTDGVDGYLVPRGDAASLAARIAQLLDNPTLHATMGASARMTIERRYDAQVIGPAFLDIWDRLAREAAP